MLKQEDTNNGSTEKGNSTVYMSTVVYALLMALEWRLAQSSSSLCVGGRT